MIRSHRVGALGVLLALIGPVALAGQESLTLVAADGEAVDVPLVRDQGFTALPAESLEAVGWAISGEGGVWSMDFGPLTLQLTPGQPLIAWGAEQWVQLFDAPYLENGALHIPLQLVTDVFPDRLHGAFRSSHPHELAAAGARPAEATAAPVASSAFVVVIDPGHGGDDPGALGPGGTREKDVALGVALALAEALEGEPGIEVHLTRDRDVLVPIWERGELATRLRGDRPGIFVSIHANALSSRTVRGVETYFLSEARTEHERRVAALENAPIATSDRTGVSQGFGTDLGFILKELRNHDHLHWSAELAVLVQRHLARVHPGPDRGVKQGPFAVITNALMPSVLVEVGFLTHPSEEGVLADPGFQKDAASALARAITEFSMRYPPRPVAAHRERP